MVMSEMRPASDHRRHDSVLSEFRSLLLLQTCVWRMYYTHPIRYTWFAPPVTNPHWDESSPVTREMWVSWMISTTAALLGPSPSSMVH